MPKGAAQMRDQCSANICLPGLPTGRADEHAWLQVAVELPTASSAASGCIRLRRRTWLPAGTLKKAVLVMAIVRDEAMLALALK